MPNADDSGTGAGEPRARGKKGWNAWWEERSLPQKILMGAGFGALGLGLLALFGLAAMLLWNWLVPSIFGLRRINLLEAFGLLLLSQILFKGTGKGLGGSRGDRKRKQELRKRMDGCAEADRPVGAD